jgi:hypothetical protein
LNPPQTFRVVFKNGLFGAFAFALLVPNFLSALTIDSNLTLTPPILTNSQVQFSLLGEPGVTCVIQSSSDLLNWMPVLTNSESGTTRIVTLDAVNDAVFYRATIPFFPHFGYALASRTTINANGNSFTTDSFNSADTNLSNNGVYSAAKTSTNGDVAIVQGIVNIGNHTIDGNLFLGPAASYTSGTNHVLGSIYTNRTLNFPDVALPPSLGFTIFPAVSGGHYNITVNGNYFINGSLPIKVAAGLTNVTILVIAQNFNPSYIDIGGGMTNPASLVIYDAPPASGGTASLPGNMLGGAIATRPLNFIFYGMPNLSGLTIVGNSSFIGVIYAPSSNVTLNGGGRAENLIGCCIANSITLNNSYIFDFDEDLLHTLQFP